MSNEDIDALLDRAVGGAWVKFTRKEHGVIKGTIIAAEFRPKTFEGAPVLNRKTGAQREELVVTFEVDDPDPDVVDDDRIRKVSLNESATRALSIGKRTAGLRTIIGARFGAQVTKDPASTTEQAEYRFDMKPPAPVSADAIDSLI